MQSTGQGMKRIKGIRTGRFVAINANGDLYTTVSCHFKESHLSSLCFSFPLCKGSQYKQENIFIFESLPSSFHARWVFSSRRSHSLIGTNICKPLLKESDYSERVNFPGGGRVTPYGEAPPERGNFFRLQVYEWVEISLVEVYKRVRKSVTWICDRAQKSYKVFL